jgi:hypothetical protein
MHPPLLLNADVLTANLITFPSLAADSLTSYGSRVIYRCLSGFWFSRDVTTATAICDANGYWTVAEFNQLADELSCAR